MLIFELPVFILTACFNLHSEIRGNIKIFGMRRQSLYRFVILQAVQGSCSAGWQDELRFLSRVSVFQDSPTVPNLASKKRWWQLLSSIYWWQFFSSCCSYSWMLNKDVSFPSWSFFHVEFLHFPNHEISLSCREWNLSSEVMKTCLEFLCLCGFVLGWFFLISGFFVLKLCRMVFSLEILNQWANDCKYKIPRYLLKNQKLDRQALRHETTERF